MFADPALADLRRVYHLATDLSRSANRYKLSAHALLAAIQREVPNTEVSSQLESRHLLHVLSFDLAHLHSDHYFEIGRRDDVVYHRSRFSKLYYALLKSRKVRVINGDASFVHENDRSKIVWVPRDVENSDLGPFGTGVGRRLNFWEFVTKAGLLTHPDGTIHESFYFDLTNGQVGTSAGTVFPIQATQKADDIIMANERGVEAIESVEDFEDIFNVVVVDGAKPNKTLPANAINPNYVYYQ
jgi:hypothetical protein